MAQHKHFSQTVSHFSVEFLSSRLFHHSCVWILEYEHFHYYAADFGNLVFRSQHNMFFHQH